MHPALLSTLAFQAAPRPLVCPQGAPGPPASGCLHHEQTYNVVAMRGRHVLNERTRSDARSPAARSMSVTMQSEQ